MPVPCVSIIVPIYNVEKYLKRCLESLMNQTLKNIEIILVDDESPDLCPSMCEEAKAKDKRIKVIHKKNQGLGLARNSGLAAATGEYVYFVDSDDYISLTAAEILYKAAKAENLDICFAGIILENDNGKQRTNIPQYSGRNFYQPEITTVVLKEMLGEKPKARKDTGLRMSVWQGIYKRSWIESENLRFPSEREFISEDIIFHLDALPKATSMKYLSDCVYYHIIDNPASLTHKYNPERFQKDCILYLEEKRRISFINDNAGMLERVQRTYLGNVRVCLKGIVRESYSKGKKFADMEIKKIVDSDTLQDVLKVYPYLKNPWKQAVISMLLKYKMIHSVRYITHLFLVFH